MTSAAILERFRARDRSALARTITWAENRDPRFRKVIAEVWGGVGGAWRIGITGPPGAGKSTLVNELARLERADGREVGILAVDPSSPFTGGALLGDRIRMEERTLDPGVFIRSMASRDSHGGLARAAVDALDAMDAFGLETLLCETVGVGQAEYDVMRAADTVVVVLCPGAGDGVQAMKAGLLEVADVLVVNKSDLPGADRMVTDLEEGLAVRWNRPSDWVVPIVSVSAGRGEGLDELRERLADHRRFQEQRGLDELRRGRRLAEVRGRIDERLSEEIWERRGLTAALERTYDAGEAPDVTAGRVVERILAEVGDLVDAAAGGAPANDEGTTTKG